MAIVEPIHDNFDCRPRVPRLANIIPPPPIRIGTKIAYTLVAHYCDPPLPMRMLGPLKTRLRARNDSEHEQAALRIVIVGLVLGYMALFHGSPAKWSSADWTIILVLTGFFAVAVGIFLAICLWPNKNVPRRLIGMLADNGGATWYMCLAGEYGFSMIGVFLFVTFGNGFRYGRRYLFGSQALSLLGYGAVLAFVPYWEAHRSAGIGLLIALIALPLYISTLLKRIQEARSKAEEANLAKTSFLANMSHDANTAQRDCRCR